MLQSVGLQRVEHDLATEQQQILHCSHEEDVLNAPQHLKRDFCEAEQIFVHRCIKWDVFHCLEHWLVQRVLDRVRGLAF